MNDTTIIMGRLNLRVSGVEKEVIEIATWEDRRRHIPMPGKHNNKMKKTTNYRL